MLYILFIILCFFQELSSKMWKTLKRLSLRHLQPATGPYCQFQNPILVVFWGYSLYLHYNLGYFKYRVWARVLNVVTSVRKWSWRARVRERESEKERTVSQLYWTPSQGAQQTLRGALFNVSLNCPLREGRETHLPFGFYLQLIKGDCWALTSYCMCLNARWIPTGIPYHCVGEVLGQVLGQYIV